MQNFKGNVALNGGAFNYAGSCETSVLINNSSFEDKHWIYWSSCCWLFYFLI